MSKPIWTDFARLAQFYLEAAVAVQEIRQEAVPAAALAVRFGEATNQGRRLITQSRLMEADPLMMKYGRHEQGDLKGEVRLPMDWPAGLLPSEWQPVNDVVENLKLANAAMQAASDLMARTP